MGVLSSSPRRRRRLIWLSGGLAIGLTVALLIVFERNTAKPTAPVTAGKPKVFASPKRVPLGRAGRKSVFAVADEFMKTAVVRHDTARSWALASPGLRAGYTRASWAKGDIPVDPFPIAAARTSVSYSYRNQIGLQVELVPKPKSSTREMTFLLDLRRYGRGSSQRWLVDSWVPAPNQLSQASSSNSNAASSAVANLSPPKSLSQDWLLVPLGILLLIVVLPVAIGVRHWLIGRRAMREYERSLSTRS